MTSDIQNTATTNHGLGCLAKRRVYFSLQMKEQQVRHTHCCSACRFFIFPFSFFFYSVSQLRATCNRNKNISFFFRVCTLYVFLTILKIIATSSSKLQCVRKKRDQSVFCNIFYKTWAILKKFGG